ncbi:MAG: small acid-soluble spore protein Tlp [Syntrophomonadaceae bacterium]|jgi:small acid-soluble spore protein (thioredoxin-like protein)
MKPNPDDRRDNVDKIQENITNTIQNIEKAEETMSLTDNCEMKRAIAEKNERRRDALQNMRNEIRDEAEAQSDRR